MQSRNVYVGKGWYLLIVVAASFVFLLGGLGSGYAASFLKEKVIYYGKFAKGTKIFTYITDPEDHRRLTFVVKGEDSKEFVQIQDKPLAPFDNIGLGYPLYSPSGGHIAYVAFRDGKARVVIDNDEQSLQFDAIDDVVFSSQGNRHAYRAQLNKGQAVVVDDKQQQKYAAIIRDTLIFSPDEKHFAYVAYVKKNTMIVVYDDKKFGPYITARELMFSPDSQTFVFQGLHGKHWYLVKDGKKEEGYVNISDMMFSPNSKHFVYNGHKIMKDKTPKMIQVYDGKARRQYDGVGNSAFSPDSSMFLFMAKEGDDWRCFGGKTEGPAQEAPSPIYFSPDSKKYIYFEFRGGKATLVLNGKPQKTYDAVGTVVFSPDSKQYACRVRKGDEWHIVQNGKDLKSYKKVRKPVFSPDSKHLAYTAVIADNVMCVVRDEVEGAKYTNVNYPVFSPDGNHVAYAANRGSAEHGGDAWILVVDKYETKGQYGGFIKAHEVSFVGNDTVYNHCYDSEKGFFRVEAKLP